MKYKEVLEMGLNELSSLEVKLRGELTDLRLKVRLGQLAQTSRVGGLRRDIARVLTAKKIKRTDEKRQAK